MNKIYNNSLLSNDIEKIKNIIAEKINYKSDLFYADLKKYLSCPSKFIRPILCVLFQRAMFKDVNDNILKTAAIIEMAHNASLLHDDVIDDATIRRNDKSFNALTNNKTAILTGDLLIAKILFILNEIDNKEITNLFAQAIEKMSEGEINQFYNKFKMPTLDEYYEKNNNKTGQLFRISVLAPAIIEKKLQYKKDLEQFAYHFANAFQIRDDINNYFELSVDKPSKTDELQGIYTLPKILKENISSTNLYEECCKILTHQVNLCIESLAFLEDSEYKEMIISLCQSLLEETK